jgi:hypothetical protein
VTATGAGEFIDDCWLARLGLYSREILVSQGLDSGIAGVRRCGCPSLREPFIGVWFFSCFHDSCLIRLYTTGFAVGVHGVGYHN